MKAEMINQNKMIYYKNLRNNNSLFNQPDSRKIQMYLKNKKQEVNNSRTII